MPVGTDIPVVIQVGKWRREIKIPAVAACTDTPVLDKRLTRLPRNQSEGNIPRIAITTGGADALECLPYKLGVEGAEFTNPTGTGRVHLYSGNGTDRYAPALGGAVFPAATTLWDTTAHLMPYDIAIFSCEGGQLPATKPQTAMQAVHDYAGIGGRVFMSHWHNYWIQQGPPSWQSTATFNFLSDLGNVTATVDIRGHAPVLLTSPDGRISHFPRAWATVTTEDGRSGVGWVEWNRNQP